MSSSARISALFGSVLVAVALMAVGAHTEEAKKEAKQEIPAGQQVFLKYKCNSCHTLEAAKIAKVEIEEEEGEEVPESDTKPPDLSGTGKKHTAAWFEKWLTKKEMIEGERHPKKFRGTPEELKTVSAWLETFKVEAKKAKKS